MDVLGAPCDNTNVIRVAERGVDCLNSGSCGKSFDGLEDAVGNVFGLNLVCEDFAFEFGVCMLYEGG